MKMTTTRSFAPTEITHAQKIMQQLMTEPPHPLGALWDGIETLLKKGWTHQRIADRFANSGITITQEP
jgi:hypothetical protein